MNSQLFFDFQNLAIKLRSVLVPDREEGSGLTKYQMQNQQKWNHLVEYLGGKQATEDSLVAFFKHLVHEEKTKPTNVANYFRSIKQMLAKAGFLRTTLLFVPSLCSRNSGSFNANFGNQK